MYGPDGLLAFGRRVGFSVASGRHPQRRAAGAGTGQVDTLTASLITHIVREPLQLWNFGHVVDRVGGCGAAWSAAVTPRRVRRPDPRDGRLRRPRRRRLRPAPRRHQHLGRIRCSSLPPLLLAWFMVVSGWAVLRVSVMAIWTTVILLPTLWLGAIPGAPQRRAAEVVWQFFRPRHRGAGLHRLRQRRSGWPSNGSCRRPCRPSWAATNPFAHVLMMGGVAIAALMLLRHIRADVSGRRGRWRTVAAGWVGGRRNGGERGGGRRRCVPRRRGSGGCVVGLGRAVSRRRGSGWTPKPDAVVHGAAAAGLRSGARAAASGVPAQAGGGGVGAVAGAAAGERSASCGMSPAWVSRSAVAATARRAAVVALNLHAPADRIASAVPGSATGSTSGPVRAAPTSTSPAVPPMVETGYRRIPLPRPSPPPDDEPPPDDDADPGRHRLPSIPSPVADPGAQTPPMTSPTEQRRAFDAAMDSYRAGDTAARAGRVHPDHRREPGDVRRLAGPAGLRRPRRRHAGRRARATPARCTGRPAASACNDGELYAPGQRPAVPDRCRCGRGPPSGWPTPAH